MTFLRKHSAKIFFAATCVLLALSLSFSAVSLARYVSHSDLDEGAGAAAIKCGFTVDGQNNPFINTPFMLKLGDTDPVRMNDWMESNIEIYNGGDYGIDYGYSIVLYLPKYFAESAMIQLLELSSAVDASSLTRARAVEKASAIYALDGSHSLEKITTTADGVELPNDYASYMGGESEIALSGSGNYDSAYNRTASVTRTYIANKKKTSDQDLDEYVTTVAATDDEQIEYCRITVNLNKKSSENLSDYVIKEGANNHKFFTLRLSLRASVIGGKEGASVTDPYFANKWDAFAAKYASGLPAGKTVLQLPAGMKYTWKTGDDKGELSVYEGTDSTKAVAVDMSQCIGVLSPSRMSVVFTQMQ